MNTCGTCRHWGAGYNEHEEPGASIGTSLVLKPCGAVIHVDKVVAEYYGSADDDHARLRAEIEAVRARKAVVIDGSDYYAALKVREDFGCVLWEGK